MKEILIALVAACLCFGAARAQGHTSAAIFPQLGHSEAVTSIAFSPDGKLLASGGLDGTVEVWDVGSRRELRTLSGTSGAIAEVSFSPDGKQLAAADQAVQVWDVSTGKQIQSLDDVQHNFNSISFSPDGKTIATGNSDLMVELWNLASGSKLRSLSGRMDTLDFLAFSPDGKVLAGSGGDNIITLWNVANGRIQRTLTAVTEQPVALGSVAFSPDGKLLASSGKQVRLWSPVTGRLVRTIVDPGYSVAFSHDGNSIMAVATNHQIKFWDVASGLGLRTLDAEKTRITSVAYTPDGKTIALGGLDTSVNLWDVASGRPFSTLIGHAARGGNLIATPDGKTLAMSVRGGPYIFWDAATGHELKVPSGIGASDWLSRDLKLAVRGRVDTIHLVDVASGHQLMTIGLVDGDGHSTAVSTDFSPDDLLLATGDSDGTVKIWNAASGQLLHQLDNGGLPVVNFSPDGTMLAACSGAVTKLWDVASGSELHALDGHTEAGTGLRTLGEVHGDVNAVAFSPDGAVLATGSADHTITVWDVASGRKLHSLEGHLDEIWSVAFSRDGKLLVSGSNDGTAKLWDVASGRELRSFSAHTGAVFKALFSGDAVVSIGVDGVVRQWDVRTGDERAAFIAFDDGSYIAVTPEGFFDSSSAAAEDHLNVRVGQRVFGISSFRENFYRPDLVKLSLAGHPLAEFGSVDSVKLSPVVQLDELPQSTADPRLKLTLHLSDGGGGVGTVRVFSKNTVIIQDTGSDSLTRSYTVPLFNGANPLRVSVSNAAGDMWSDATATVTAALPANDNAIAPHGTLHAVVLGIQEFPKSPENNLRYSVGDAKLFAETLTKYSALLFAKLDIQVLTTAAETDRDHVLAALKAMQSTVGPGDAFVFYAASHGIVGGDGEYYLITSNVSSVDPQSLKADAISRRQLTDLLANIQTTNKVVFIDTCQAGALGDAAQQAFSTRGMSPQTAAAIISRQIGLTMLMATSTNQQAFEGYQDHGLFTFVLADGLAGKAADATSGIVSSASLASYVDLKVPPLAQSLYKSSQQPTANESGQPFPLTKVR